MTTSDADKILLDGFIHAVDASVEAGREVHLTCAHCEEEVVYPGDVILMPGRYLRTGEPVVSVLHRECEEPYRVACDKEIRGG